jgi:hypothetical protein
VPLVPIALLPKGFRIFPTLILRPVNDFLTNLLRVAFSKKKRNIKKIKKHCAIPHVSIGGSKRDRGLK